MYVGLHVGLSYISDCQLFGMHCQKSSMMFLIIEKCIGLLFSPIYIFLFFSGMSQPTACIPVNAKLLMHGVRWCWCGGRLENNTHI